ncbi:MAG: hypothetical protein M3N32_06745 [Actinomycetota bacterium]|nr:hypothetical protein [Actinomycetota bacterium]
MPVKTTAFTAARHGFHFANAFKNNIQVIAGFPPITTYGLCGGMSFAALDYYHENLPIPNHVAGAFPDKEVPPNGRLRGYIFQRQVDSFNPLKNPDMVKFVTQKLPVPFGRSAFDVTIQDEFPLLVKAIDAGTPVPLGLIADSANPADCHQVVAVGYDTRTAMKVQIWDCNHPDKALTLELDAASSLVKESTGEKWVGFCLQTYSKSIPSYVDVRLASGIHSHPPVATLGRPVSVGFSVRNDGDHDVHISSLDASLTGPQGENLDGSFRKDGIGTNLVAGATQSYLATNNSFGISPGRYTAVAWYQSARGEWFKVPPGEPGTQTATRVRTA